MKKTALCARSGAEAVKGRRKMNPLFIYLLIVNALAYILMGDDKRRAIMKSRRIPEKVLLLAALIGGSLGELLGMLSYHHKTRHKKFYIGVPVLLVVQVVALVLAPISW